MWNLRREEWFVLLIVIGAFTIGLGIKLLGGIPTPPPPSPTLLITVKIYGAVKNPGQYRVPAESPIGSVIEKAGGTLPWADPSHLNLSTPLSSTTVFIPEGTLNLNQASLEDLTFLPGIGPELAQRIITYRENAGKFTTLSQLKEVPGIGEVRFQKIKDKLALG